MFRLPTDATHPTYDHTTPITFWRWLTSTKTDRAEWRRRRDIATRVARDNQNRPR